jgi:hypothetical protein
VAEQVVQVPRDACPLTISRLLRDLNACGPELGQRVQEVAERHGAATEEQEHWEHRGKSERNLAKRHIVKQDGSQ